MVDQAYGQRKKSQRINSLVNFVSEINGAQRSASNRSSRIYKREDQRIKSVIRLTLTTTRAMIK